MPRGPRPAGPTAGGDCTIAPSSRCAPTEIATERRDPNPVTGFDPEDDLDLLDLRIGYNAPGMGDRTYWGPQVLINTTFNLVGDDELAWRDRKGESFTLSPLYCGSKRLGYACSERNTKAESDAGPGDLDLGRGRRPEHEVLPVRLPDRLPDHLQRPARLLDREPEPVEPGPRSWLDRREPEVREPPLHRVLRPDRWAGEFVHLSDGGHFENLGVYELIRRRCRYIVACDAGEDTGPSDENLATLIRLCRIDFGVRIQIDTEPSAPEGPDRLTRSHVVVGRIRYDDVDSGSFPGYWSTSGSR